MAARKRWRILRRAIVSAESPVTLLRDEAESTTIVRKFCSYGLFQVDQLARQWFLCSYTPPRDQITLQKTMEARIKILEPHVSLEEMIGFNNTGNLCIWPAEEVLAFHCLTHRELFKGASVCELGCGMTGLAGLMLALTNTPSHVMLTDGNERSIKNVKEIIVANEAHMGDTNISCDILRWDNSSLKDNYYGKFDYVLCADCLFFENLHHQLVLIMQKLLKPNGGTAIIYAPRRGGTLAQFCSIAEGYFQVEQSDHYDDVVWRMQQEKPCDFNADLNSPLKIILKTL